MSLAGRVGKEICAVATAIAFRAWSYSGCGFGCFLGRTLPL
jgi:hypothetical protein